MTIVLQVQSRKESGILRPYLYNFSTLTDGDYILDREIMELAEDVPLSVMERIALRYVEKLCVWNIGR